MKNLRHLLFSLLAFFALTIQTNATASLSTSKTQVTKGSNFTVSVKVSSVAAWNVHVSASGPVKGCSIHEADSSSNAKNTTKTFSSTCTSTGIGTITITLTGDTTTASGTNQKLSSSKTVKVVNVSSNNNTTTNDNNSKNTNLSSDNTLKSLSVSSGTLSPEFKKDVTEYKVEVENEIEKIKINATANDKEATIKGIGEKSLKVGKNSYGIVVVAENGKTKTYTVVVTRKEEDPVFVTIDNVKYQVVRDLKELEIPKNFKETTIKIEDKDVTALYDEITKFTLVALKDENNNVKLYICDVNKNTYTLFQEEQFIQERIMIMDMPTKIIPDGYKKYRQYINGNKYEVYKLSKTSDYALIYALNLDTNCKKLYLYDSEENTIQRYTKEYSDLIDEKYNNLFYVTLGLCGVIVILIIVLFTLLIKKGQYKKRKIEKSK